ncbi:uncharacterized protein LOC123658665 [Melitaea cinxia]|uniref:uncharacterized protein LOC123658665 n=1 Tax=Melitaea cinxia TaxID=113334 RepID=UPI001E27149F|nr:uncharacterized protein LOC123658665 [Melitaea cinxia]
MYSFMTVPQLKAELRKRNATTAGKKADLIERLRTYDQNQNFCADCDIQEDPAYVCPPSDTFRDINADTLLPMITRQAIQEYFVNYRYSTQPKGLLLYESRHLVTARFSNEGNYTYVRGQCKASMKKVAYVVDVKLSKDGVIEECHCDCAAGSGTQASCKHVSVLLFGIHEMVHKKSIKLHQSCTEKLMTFNRPSKVFYNSPIAAHNLPSKRLKSCNFKPLNESDVMENYPHYVRNLVIGYGESSMPLLQTYEPANPHGIEWDHYPYLAKTPQDNLLEKLLLKNVTNEKIQALEKNTRAQNASAEWHEMRSCRITASMFYVVCHSKTCTKSLLQKIFAPKTVHTRAMVHGKIHETIAIAKYEATYGLSVQACGLFISSEYPFLAASPDGLLGEDTIIEVKCPYTARNCKITNVSVPYLERCNGQFLLKKKHPYYAQIQGQLYCSAHKTYKKDFTCYWNIAMV